MSAELVAGGIALGSGVVLALVSAAISPHPVKPNERSRLAYAYNEALAQELGIDLGGASP